MNLNSKNFISLLNKNYIFENNPQIAVAVSGGPDSIALVHLLHLWIKSKNGNLIALLVNHKLREESYFENLQIKNYLKKLKIRSKILNISNCKIIKKNMNEARINRYDILTKYCKLKNLLHLFIGHHFDDNLETFLTRRVSGSNLIGLASMSNLIIRNNIQIIRPLLKFSKKQIINYNIKNSLIYINDPSNVNSKYTRVVIRNFINDNNSRQLIKKDFLYISKFVEPYKEMIWAITIKLIKEINQRKIIIFYIDLIKLDKLIVEKIIQIFHKFFFPKKVSLRSSKLENFFIDLETNNNKCLNIGGLIIKKRQEYLIFYRKN